MAVKLKWVEQTDHRYITAYLGAAIAGRIFLNTGAAKKHKNRLQWWCCLSTQALPYGTHYATDEVEAREGIERAVAIFLQVAGLQQMRVPA
jgi:hypothetical protein